MAKAIDLTGQKFGHLTVLKWLGTINHNSKYLVKCDCGKEYEIYASNLIQGVYNKLWMRKRISRRAKN